MRPAPDGGVGPAPVTPRPFRRWAWLFVKIAVTSGVILWIALEIDWADFWQKLLLFPLSIIALVTVLRLSGVLISAVKWQQLLRVHALRYPYWTLTRWYTIGFFLSQFLPSVIGGDGYRIYKTYRNGRHPACAVLPVFVERASGLLALLLMGAVAAAIDWFANGNALSGWVSALSLAGFAGGAIGVFGAVRLGLVGRLLAWQRCPGAVRSLVHHADDYFHHPREIAIAALISFVFHGIRILTFWLLFVGLGEDVTLFQIAVVTAVTTVVGMLPFSLGGIGLVDGSFIVLMTFYGVPEEAGLTAMLITRVTILPLPLVGGLLYAFYRDAPARPSAEEAEGDERHRAHGDAGAPPVRPEVT